MSKKPDESYVPPEVEGLGDEDKSAAAVTGTAVATTVNKTPSLPGKVIPLRLGIGELVNAQGDVVTDVFKARIANHMEYISGKKGFATAKDKADEQGTFIELIMNSLELDFDKYVVVTDYLLTVLRERTTDLSGAQMRRFITSVDPLYDRHKVKMYGEYMTFLTRIALNWQQRYRLSKLIDATYAAREFSEVGKRNVAHYFSKLMDV